MRAFPLIAALIVLAACNRAPDGGVPYHADLDVQKDGGLVVTVAAGGAGLASIRESARYVVTQHCLQKTGSSLADWRRDANGEWAQARDDKGNVILRATCRV